MKKIFRVLGVILLTYSIHACKKDKPKLPVVTTTDVTEVSYTTATSGGEVSNEGGAPVTSRGVCWNTSIDPTIGNSKTNESGGGGSFTSKITQLLPSTLYYVRAYASNSAGTAYGDHVTFTTNQVEAPSLTTKAVNSITANTAASGGTVVTDNGGFVTVKGVCWSTNQNPTLADAKTLDGVDTGAYVSVLTGLRLLTKYYIRSYATNSAGTTYGNELNFTTIANLPTLNTTDASTIGATFAVSGGIISNDGGSAVTGRGVCWGTTQYPTVLDNTSNDGSGTGTFTSLITPLTALTNYYVRAYATNSAGTAYGCQVSFRTNINDEYAANIIPTGLALGESGISSASQLAYIVLTWDAIANPVIDHYVVEYKRSSYSFFTEAVAKSNTIKLDLLIPNISYDFQIASASITGTTSNFTSILTLTTKSQTFSPATVTGVSVIGLYRAALLQWTPNTSPDVVSYKIYRNTSNDPSTSTLVDTYIGNSYTDNGLVSGITYYYWIKAMDTSGNLSANYSVMVSATTSK
jgi:hypothetical protein